MAEQHLNGAQIRAGLKQMSGEAVTKGMRMQSFLNMGTFGGLTAGVPDDLRVEGMVGRMPLAPGKKPGLRFTTQTAIVLSQRGQQIRAEHDIAIFASLASLNMDHHAPAVDIGDLEKGQSGSPHSSAVQRHQDGVMKRTRRSVDQTGNFVLAQNDGQLYPPFWVWRFFDVPGSFQGPGEEETERGDSLAHGVVSEFPDTEHVCCKFADFLRAELIRRAVEMACEILNGMQVGTRGSLCVITTLEFFERDFS